MSNAKKLDQFYTSRKTSQQCLHILEKLLNNHYDLNNTTFLEPSAGDGSFLDALNDKKYSWIAGDIEPHNENIIKTDFLQDYNWELDKDKDIIIGNPPFGKRSSLAIDFVNKGLELVDTVAFILPIQFNKYLTQKKINDDAQLINSTILKPDSFIFNNKNYSVRTVFQVWTLKDNIGKDQRIRTAPPTKHKDFHLEYYNCVPEKLHLFEKEWDFAVLRQGWGDFNPIVLDDYNQLSKKKQWMFFKSDNKNIIKKLKNIDYNNLAEKNTSVRGFGKADIIAEYNSLYNKKY